jgi:hypothetical protein
MMEEIRERLPYSLLLSESQSSNTCKSSTKPTLEPDTLTQDYLHLLPQAPGDLLPVGS